MYECTVRFCVTGCPEHVAGLLGAVPPLPRFRHVFAREVTEETDVIVAGPDLDAAGLAALADTWGAELLVLAGPGAALPASVLARAADIWRLPLEDAELRFHFARWQERFRQGKDLWETRQFLERTLSTIPHLIWFKTRDGIHELVNDSFCRAVGKTRAQVQGRGHAYIWDVATDDPACIESERIVMESGETHVAEETIDTGAGKRVLTVYKSPLRNVDGSMMGTMGIGVDVTRERLYQERLLENNAALETIFTSMDCGILCHSLDGGHVISVNRVALRLLGFASREELAADFRMVASTVADEDKPRLRAAIGRLGEVGDSVSYEYRVIHADGGLFHVMGNARLVEKDGEIFCRRLLLDCTAQKLAEERAQSEKDRRQKELMRALSVDYQLVCVLDAASGDGTVLQLMATPDRELERIFSAPLPFRERLDTYIRTRVHPDDREALRKACSPESLAARPERREIAYCSYRALNGDSILYFQLKAVRVGARDDATEIVMGFQSVDARVREEMQQKSLLNEALAQARRASEAKSLFLSNMSHDIRTPMNAVVGYTALALSHLGQAERVEGYLRKIRASGNHLISLINDVLDMSSIESGKIRLEEKPQELSVLLREIRNIVQPKVDARRQTLSLNIENMRDARVLCDRLRLNQILLNLLDNAVKYTGEGGAIRLRVRQRDCAAPGHAAYEFRIRDNGIGMSEEFLTRIFEPFERAQNSTVAGIQGTGLGMAITKNMVEMMRGDIEVHSALGVGTEFVFRVLFRLPPDAAARRLLPAEAHRALVVEGDARSRESLGRLLDAGGVRVDLAATPETALDLARAAGNDGYSLCLISREVPGGGARLARRIREAVGDKRLFVALLGGNWTEAGSAAPEAGVDACLGMPLFWSDVRACLSPAGETSESADDRQRTGGRTGHILLAEDNAMNQEIAVEFLTEAGYSVDVAANGREAVEMLAASAAAPYDVVLMDVQMPVLDGYGATQAIRALDDAGLASVPIIAMTANSFEEDKQEALARGMNGHIAKPIDFHILFRTLDTLLG